MPGVLPRVRLLEAIPLAPVVTVESEKVPPPDVMLRVTGTFAAAFPSSPVAVTVTVAVVPGAPLAGFTRTARVPPVCVPDPGAVEETVTVTLSIASRLLTTSV